MKVSIDALRQRKREIETKIEPLIAANQALYDTAHEASRDFTPVEASTFPTRTWKPSRLSARISIASTR